MYATKTFFAKNGVDLYQSGWYPIIVSHSILITLDGQSADVTIETDPASGEKVIVYKFQYITKSTVWYTVRYVDAETGEELYTAKEVETDYDFISEVAPVYGGYIVDSVTKSIGLAASASNNEDEAKKWELENNVITFYYTKNDTDMMYMVEHYTQDIDETYTVYLSQQYTVKKGTTVTIADLSLTSLNSSGFVWQADVTTVAHGDTVEDITGETFTINVDDDGNRPVIRLYYNRDSFPYIIRYVESGTENILKTLPDSDTYQALFGTTISHTADSTVVINGQTYIIVGDTERTLEIRAEYDLDGNKLSRDDIAINVLTIYYQQQNTIVINYQIAVIPSNLVQGDDITLSLNYEIVTITSGVLNSIQGSSVLFYNTDKYVFLGWYDNSNGDGDCITTKADLSDLVIKGLDPTTSVTYYAVFQLLQQKLKIEIQGGQENEHFLYKIVSEDGSELIVSVRGGSSTTTLVLPAGDYTVTEISAWSWKYDVEISVGDANIWTVDEQGNATTSVNTDMEYVITFKHVRNSKKWLGGEQCGEVTFQNVTDDNAD